MQTNNQDIEREPQGFSPRREQEEAFEELKTRFTTVPILSHFDPGRRTVVETDARDFVLGCVLFQTKEDGFTQRLFIRKS